MTEAKAPRVSFRLVPIGSSDASASEEWSVSHITLTEALSEPYHAYMALVAANDSNPGDLLGRRVTVLLERGDSTRCLYGIIDEVSTGDHHVPAEHDVTSCTVRVVPALSLFAHRHNSRIFQESSIREILGEVLKPLSGYNATFELRLRRRHSVYEYRTQYDETDLELIQRLVGDEALFYFFEFDVDKNVEHLVIADDVTSYLPLESDGGNALHTILVANMDEHEGVTSFMRTERTQPTTLRLKLFDWTRPDASIDGSSPPSNEVPAGAKHGPEREVYEHDVEGLLPHSYDAATLQYGGDEHESQLGLRRHMHSLGAQSFTGSGTAIGTMPGRSFKLMDHPIDDHLCGDYAFVSVSHDIAVGTPDGSTSDGSAPTRATGEDLAATYSNRFMVVPATMLYLIPRRRRRRIPGIITAMVVGPAGQEMHTDEHGRVKVQFHWDRAGQSDEYSSCYVRVMQAWAGAGWGTWFLPRIGMEAVISFIDGDPDRPVVTGTLYNGKHRTPFPLPDEMTRSGLRTNSSPTTGGFNELRFEDTAGAEEVYLRAEKDFNELIKHNHSTHVLVDQANIIDGMHTVTVGQDRAVVVGQNETITIGASRTETVTGAEKIRLLDVRDTDITRSDRLVVHETRNEEVQGAFAGNYLGGRTVLVEHGDIETVEGSDKSVTVHGEYGIEVDDSFRVKRADTEVYVEEEIEATSPTKIFLVVGGNHVELENGGTVTVTAASELVLQCGNSKVCLRSDGSIELNGTSKIDMIVGATTVETMTSGHVITGTQVDIKGEGQVTIVGPMVKIN